MSGCSQLDIARDPDEIRAVIQGQPFRHLVLSRNFQLAPVNIHEPVFVFLENDGLPWQTPTLVSNDPTPRKPVALALFRSTAAPAIYLGRPCQWVHTFETPCESYYWTHGRFDPDVVRSLIAVLRKIVPPISGVERPLILVGHSGGGTLATLIAHALDRPVAVLTLAPVLDHQKWTTRLGLSPLTGSLNPASEVRTSHAALNELHVFGARDDVVNPGDAAAYLQRYQVDTLTLPQADHRCCWANWWTAEGFSLARRLAQRLPGAR